MKNWMKIGMIISGFCVPSACGGSSSDDPGGSTSDTGESTTEGGGYPAGGSSSETTTDSGDGGLGGEDTSCGKGSVECGSSCVDTDFDPNNCGSCGNSCSEDEVCQMGDCALLCLGGTLRCDDRCVDPNLDLTNCGSCGNTCGASELCDGGECSFSCSEGRTECDGQCENTDRDPLNCGTCGVECDPGEACSKGKCVLSCAEGQLNCDGECINPLTDERYCGATGKCSVATSETDGGDRPKDWKGTACSEGFRCEEGICALSCAGDLLACDEACVDPKTDRNHCGTCDEECGAEENCYSGECLPTVHICVVESVCDSQSSTGCYCDSDCENAGDCCSPDGQNGGSQYFENGPHGQGVRAACGY